MHEDPLRDRPVPLSVNQDSYLFGEWVGHLRSADASPLVSWCGLDFDAEPDLERLERALTAIVDRHEILRTGFTDVSSIDRAKSSLVFEQYRQLTLDSSLFSRRVYSHAPVKISVVPARHLTLNHAARSVHTDALAQDINRPFKYDAPPLMRATLVTADKNLWLLGITLHHLVCDGWSVRILRQELSAHYQALQAGEAAIPAQPNPPKQYANFSIWQRRQLERDPESHLAYWRRVWTEYLPALMTFGDIPYAASAGPLPGVVEMQVESVDIDATMSDHVATFCKTKGITPYMAWLAAMVVLYRSYTQRERIAFMSYQANRLHAEWQDVIGWFTNTYVCGVTVAPTDDGQIVLARVRERVLEARRNEMTPMGFIWSRLIREGLLDKRFSVPEWVSFDFLRVPPERNAPWRNVWSHVVGQRTKPELAVVVLEREGRFTLTCRYPGGRFPASAVAHMLDDMRHVMHRLMTSPTEPVERYQDALALR